MVTTATFPDVPLRLDGAELQRITPIAPLSPGHALSVVIIVYRDSVHVGLLTDSALLCGADRLGGIIAGEADTLDHLCEEAAPPRARRWPRVQSSQSS
ncbi:WS/DGAT domain-containing protein [Haloechinothrix sp. LS1_15]|uniref:WS/DGAT domain-containing protein n=1 Tax=Haloechinothrix sp. LS1_15 TaxID=2652248 RepID=UPI002946ABA8|nr:WS/DGAT domain-containing protein [Haloechinothrix sp. LS1_15]MDV6014291.1 DUF1298 domain-containing protein [Haloechinothrix sp. LS1_15]